MNAGRHISDYGDAAVTGPPLLQLVMIAGILSNPLRFFHSDHTAIATGDLQREQLEDFCQIRVIEKRLNATVADQIGTSRLKLCTSAVGNSQNSAVCDLIVAPYQDIQAFINQVTAVRLQHAIQNCVLRTDRQRVRSMLGDAAYNTALREAPFFYFDLGGELDRDFFVRNPDNMTLALSVGATMTYSFIANIDKGLAQIFAWRLPKAFIEKTVQLNDAKLRSFSRLLQSKGPHAHTRLS